MNEKEQIIYDNVPKVHEAGVKDGRNAEWSDFWDELQRRGNRVNYIYAFAYYNDKIFSPKYDIIGGNASAVQALFQYSSITDLKGILERQGVLIDCSKCSLTLQMFQGCSGLTRVPTLNLEKSTNTSYMFSECKNLVEIEKLIVSETTSFGSTTFYSCNSLTDIIFEGVIGGNLNMSWSPLSIASLKNIISCLKNYAGTAQEQTYTVKFSDDCWARLEADSVSPDGNTWKQYVDSLGWLF